MDFCLFVCYSDPSEGEDGDRVVKKQLDGSFKLASVGLPLAKLLTDADWPQGSTRIDC